ncbi:MAG TPA: RsmE family RNA methyltransferase [bacterium]
MHLESFYVRPEDVSGDKLIFRDGESRHLTRVLRKKAGDTVVAVDGCGKAYDVRIRSIGRGTATAEITRVRERAGEPNVELTLAQGLVKGGRFDWLVEKATEIGVVRIIPVHSKNCVVRTLSEHKMERLRKIALSAVKQSGRSLIPEITPVCPFDAVVESAAVYDVRLIADLAAGEETATADRIRNPVPFRKVLCLVGPEGGLDGTEMKRALDGGFRPISLGPRRLRSETAGIVLVSWVLSQVEPRPLFL